MLNNLYLCHYSIIPKLLPLCISAGSYLLHYSQAQINRFSFGAVWRLSSTVQLKMRKVGLTTHLLSLNDFQPHFQRAIQLLPPSNNWESVQGSTALLRLGEWYRQVEADMVSNSRNKIHQTWDWPNCGALYVQTLSTFFASQPGMSNKSIYLLCLNYAPASAWTRIPLVTVLPDFLNEAS